MSLCPGLAFAGVVAALAWGVNSAVPLLSSLVVAIIVGILARNIGLVRPSMEPGLAFTNRFVLRAGVVLLGLRLSVPAVLQLGWQPLVVIVVTVGATYAATIAIGRLLGLASPTRVLTATGTAICGAAAVAGMTAVVLPQARDESPHSQLEAARQVEDAAATAVASVTLFGTLAVFVTPWLAVRMGLSGMQTGVWLGTAIHEVGQVVAAGEIAGVTDVAVVTKLGRVALLAPMIALVGIAQRRAATVAHDGPLPEPQLRVRRAPLVPVFVIGFLAMVVVRSLVPLPSAVLGGADTLTTVLLTAAMAAMGAGVRIGTIVRTGGRAIGLGAIAALVSAVVSLGLVEALV